MDSTKTDIKWYYRTWVLVLLLFSPLAFVSLVLMFVGKRYPPVVRWLLVPVFGGCALIFTVTWLIGFGVIEPEEKEPVEKLAVTERIEEEVVVEKAAEKEPVETEKQRKAQVLYQEAQSLLEQARTSLAQYQFTSASNSTKKAVRLLKKAKDFPESAKLLSEAKKLLNSIKETKKQREKIEKANKKIAKEEIKKADDFYKKKDYQSACKHYSKAKGLNPETIDEEHKRRFRICLIVCGDQEEIAKDVDRILNDLTEGQAKKLVETGQIPSNLRPDNAAIESAIKDALIAATLERFKLRELKAEVGFQGSNISIANQNTYDWKDVTVELNPAWLTSGCSFNIGEIRAGTRQSLNLLDFTDGEDRFNPLQKKIERVKISSKSPQKDWKITLKTAHEVEVSVKQQGKLYIETIIKDAVSDARGVSVKSYYQGGYWVAIEYLGMWGYKDTGPFVLAYHKFEDASKVVFKVRDISKLRQETYLTFADQYAQEKELLGITLGISRKTYEKINWDNVSLIYGSLHRILDEHDIHESLLHEHFRKMQIKYR